jgi:hypothetical protein
MHDDAVLTLRGVEGSISKKQMRFAACPSSAAIGSTRPANAPAGDALRGCYRAPWLGFPDLCDP